jgi:hypothetical protein
LISGDIIAAVGDVDAALRQTQKLEITVTPRESPARAAG